MELAGIGVTQAKCIALHLCNVIIVYQVGLDPTKAEVQSYPR